MQKFNSLQIIKRVTVLIGVAVILLSSLISCDTRSSQQEFFHIGEPGWRSTDTFHFQTDTLLNPGYYLLSVAFRTSSTCRYPYRQLVLEVSRHFGGDGAVMVDTLNCNLTQEDGEVEGRGISVYAYDFPVDTLHITKGNSCQISIRHLMRKTPLAGIYDIGVLLEKQE